MLPTPHGNQVRGTTDPEGTAPDADEEAG